MCGIVALAGGDPSRIDAGIRALAHRGPDGNGRWLGEGIALGHTRLAVVDPAGGAQPIANEDGTVVAVVNGEIYDAAEHARRLRTKGHVLRTRCDSELLVHLYEELGDDVVRAVRGELAFALWDARRRRLLAARDRFGVKPLVFARLGDGIAIASEAKALFAMGVVARWDAGSFFQAVHTQYPLPDRTLFLGVDQLEPGHALAWQDGELRITRYYEPPFGRTGELDEAGAAEALRATLRDAVAVRLSADAPICVQLSGGVDSTAVAALARDGIGAAFTVAFADGGDYDERAIAGATARALELPLHVVEVTAGDIASRWPEAVVHGEGLAINGHLVGKFLLSRAMRDAGFKVALTGEGADELLCGYAHLRRDAGAAADHAASRGLMLPASDGALTATVQARLGFVPTWIAAKAELGARVRQLLAGDFVHAHAHDDALVRLVERTELRRLANAPMHAAASSWMRTALASYILRTLGDGMEMRHGIEGRVPFLDHHVAELALSIPPAVAAGTAIDKPVLRRAMADLVPPHVLARPKHPFLAPPLSRIAPALVQDTLRSLRSPYVDRAALVDVLDRLPAMTPREQQLWDPALMMLLSAGLLEAKYCRGGGLR